MSAVSAKSVTLKVKNGKYYEKKVGHGDLIFSHYHTKYYGQCDGSRHVHLEINGKYSRDPGYYKLTKAKIYYKYKGKVKTKTYKADKWGYSISKKVPKGYTPYKTKVYYKRQ